MKHIRVFAQVAPFWKPCIYAANMSASQIAGYEAAEAAIASFLPLINNVISIEVTDIPASPVVTTSDAHTQG